MEDSQQKDYSFWGNDTFPSLYDAQAYQRKLKSEYLERQFYERLLKSEPSIEKLIENKGSASVYWEPVKLTSDVKQRKQRSQRNSPNPNNSYKTKKNLTGSRTEVNPE